MFEKNNSNGFTLMGLVIVVAILAVLSVSVYYLVDPEKRIVDANNAVRVQDVEAIERAIKTALLDNDTPPEALVNVAEDTYYGLIVDGGNPDIYTCTELGEDISSLDIASTVTPFLGDALPIDPSISSGDNTGYYLVRRGNLFDIGYCNWSREAICGDGYCISSESCSTCEADCGSCITNSPPVEPDPDGRTPAHMSEPSSVSQVSWTAWDDPDEDVVEYYTEIYQNTTDCTGLLLGTPSWSTNTYFSPGILFRAGRTYSWHVKGRSQGESDDTDYNACYYFTVGGIVLP